MRALVVVLVLLWVSACSTSAPPTVADGDRTGPVDARVPVELRPVVSVSPPGSPTGPDDLDGEDGVYHLAPSIGRFSHFEDISVRDTETGWTVTLSLPDDTTRVLADWTTQHVADQLGVVVDGKLIVAPTISSAIVDGAVEVSNRYTESEARALARAITGR